MDSMDLDYDIPFVKWLETRSIGTIGTFNCRHEIMLNDKSLYKSVNIT